MFVTILSFIHNATTLLFGVYASAAFLGIRLNRKNNLTLLTFTCLTGGLFLVSFLLYGFSFTEQNLSSYHPLAADSASDPVLPLSRCHFHSLGSDRLSLLSDQQLDRRCRPGADS